MEGGKKYEKKRRQREKRQGWKNRVGKTGREKKRGLEGKSTSMVVLHNAFVRRVSKLPVSESRFLRPP